jgi:hypothetical protein
MDPLSCGRSASRAGCGRPGRAGRAGPGGPGRRRADGRQGAPVRVERKARRPPPDRAFFHWRRAHVVRGVGARDYVAVAAAVAVGVDGRRAAGGVGGDERAAADACKVGGLYGLGVKRPEWRGGIIRPAAPAARARPARGTMGAMEDFRV